ncbi:MAG: hypothetical protein AAF961_05080, partial [Planctomycetota bacterium]
MSGSKHLSRVTLLLVGLSTALLQIALDERNPGEGVPLLAASASLALALRVIFVRREATEWNVGLVTAVTLLGLFPFCWDVVSRHWLSTGVPLEVQMAYVLRNLMLGFAAMLYLPRAREMAALVSLFLTVVGFLWATNAWTIALLVVYATIGMWWLVGTYWELLGG